jgi:DNA polymerase-3 subunit beta
VRLELSEGTLRVTSQNPDLGDAKEDLQVTYSGPPLSIGFNARYLMDVLNVVDTPNVNLELCDELSPGVLKPDGGENAARYTAVIMPMRI